MTRQSRWAALLLTLPALWILRAPLFGPGVLYERDIHLVWYPQVESFVRAVASGSWPLWDPFLGFGQPLLADPSAQVLYPLTWINLILRPWHYYTLFAAFHLVLSAWGVHRLALRWGTSGAGALLAAGLWSLCGPWLSLVSLWHHFASTAWMPWVLLSADRATTTGRRADSAACGLIMALQILGGSADVAAMTGMIALAAAGHGAWRSPTGSARRVVTSLATAFGVALGVSAALWLPALEVAVRSARWEFSLDARTFWSAHPLGLLELLLPGLWTTAPLSPSLKAILFESRDPFLWYLYLGLPSLALAGAAFAAPGVHRRRLLLAGIIVAAVLFALGRHAPFYGIAATVAPPLRLLRYPVKALIPAALAWSLLAGLGFDVWCRAGAVARGRWWRAVMAPTAVVGAVALTGSILLWSRGSVLGPLLVDPRAGDPATVLAHPARNLTIASALAAAAVALGWSRLRGWGGSLPAAGLAVLALGDLAVFHGNTSLVAPLALFTHRPEVVDSLRAANATRIFVFDYTEAARLIRSPPGWTLPQADALGRQLYLAPATAGRWGFDGSFEKDYRGLYSHDLAALTTLLPRVADTPAFLRLLRLGGVTHVVSVHERRHDLVLLAQFPGLFREGIRLYRVPDPLPRTYAVGGARIGEGPAALALLQDPAFDLRGEVIVPAESVAPSGPPGDAGAARIVRKRHDAVEIEADMCRDGYVVLLDGYAPGWRTTVDGLPATLVKANLAFRAVRVPSGRHRIEMVYRPWSVLVGASVALISLLGTAFAAARRL